MRATSHAVVSQRESTRREDSQRALPLLSDARTIAPVDEALLDRCETMLDAVQLCIQLSRYSHQAIADQFGIDKGHFSRMLSGRASFDDRRLASLMEFAGNLAPLQWLARRMGYELVRRASEHRERRAPWTA